MVFLYRSLSTGESMENPESETKKLQIQMARTIVYFIISNHQHPPGKARNQTIVLKQYEQEQIQISNLQSRQRCQLVCEVKIH